MLNLVITGKISQVHSVWGNLEVIISVCSPHPAEMGVKSYNQHPKSLIKVLPRPSAPENLPVTQPDLGPLSRHVRLRLRLAQLLFWPPTVTVSPASDHLLMSSLVALLLLSSSSTRGPLHGRVMDLTPAAQPGAFHLSPFPASGPGECDVKELSEDVHAGASSG